MGGMGGRRGGRGGNPGFTFRFGWNNSYFIYRITLRIIAPLYKLIFKRLFVLIKLYVIFLT